VDEPPNSLTEVNKVALSRKFEFLSVLTALRHRNDRDMMALQQFKDYVHVIQIFAIPDY
jgi:hypothetical protein